MAAGNTYEAIATSTAAGSSSTVTFSSIPATYTDLILVVNGGITSGITDMNLRFNSDTGTNYSTTGIYGTGAVAGSARASNLTALYIEQAAAPDTSFSYNFIGHFMNYSNTTTYKTAVARANMVVSGRGVDVGVGLWRNTAAINSLTIFTTTNFSSGTSFNLYGIKAA
jgi:hypothetical protein